MKRAAHRPKRSYPEAPEHRCQVAMKKCPFCKGRLVSTGSREVDKYVQTLSGAVHVIGYSVRCDNEEYPHPKARYHSTSGKKLSLPYQTYGLDVMAYIAQAHQGQRKQFKEIWQELRQGYGLEISEREVGLLYRRIEALQMGSQVAIEEKLRETVEKYGCCGPKYLRIKRLRRLDSGPVAQTSAVAAAAMIAVRFGPSVYRKPGQI